MDAAGFSLLIIDSSFEVVGCKNDSYRMIRSCFIICIIFFFITFEVSFSILKRVLFDFYMLNQFFKLRQFR